MTLLRATNTVVLHARVTHSHLARPVRMDFPPIATVTDVYLTQLTP